MFLNGLFNLLLEYLWLLCQDLKLTQGCYSENTWNITSRKRNKVTVGLEPTRESFADSCLSQLGYVTPVKIDSNIKTSLVF